MLKTPTSSVSDSLDVKSAAGNVDGGVINRLMGDLVDVVGNDILDVVVINRNLALAGANVGSSLGVNTDVEDIKDLLNGGVVTDLADGIKIDGAKLALFIEVRSSLGIDGNVQGIEDVLDSGVIAELVESTDGLHVSSARSTEGATELALAVKVGLGLVGKIKVQSINNLLDTGVGTELGDGIGVEVIGDLALDNGQHALGADKLIGVELEVSLLVLAEEVLEVELDGAAGVDLGRGAGQDTSGVDVADDLSSTLVKGLGGKVDVVDKLKHAVKLLNELVIRVDVEREASGGSRGRSGENKSVDELHVEKEIKAKC